MGHKLWIGKLQGLILKLTLDVLELMVKKEKVLAVYKGSFLRNIAKGAEDFFLSLKKGLYKKKSRKPCYALLIYKIYRALELLKYTLVLFNTINHIIYFYF